MQAILSQRCTGCHGASNPSGGRSWTDVGASIDDTSNIEQAETVIIPGNKEDSVLYRVLRGPVGDIGEMPKSNPGSVPDAERDTIGAWIDALPVN